MTMITLYPVYSEKPLNVKAWAAGRGLSAHAKYAYEVIPNHYLVSNRLFEKEEAESLLAQIGDKDSNPTSWV